MDEWLGARDDGHVDRAEQLAARLGVLFPSAPAR
jgi:hypothetical protein